MLPKLLSKIEWIGFHFRFLSHINSIYVGVHRQPFRVLLHNFVDSYLLFVFYRLLLELPPTGGVLPSYIIYIERFFIRGYWEIFLLVLFAIFVIYVLVYTVSELFEMFYFKLHYLGYFWNACDLTILIVSNCKYNSVWFKNFTHILIWYFFNNDYKFKRYKLSYIQQVSLTIITGKLITVWDIIITKYFKSFKKRT